MLYVYKPQTKSMKFKKRTSILKDSEPVKDVIAAGLVHNNLTEGMKKKNSLSEYNKGFKHWQLQTQSAAHATSTNHILFPIPQYLHKPPNQFQEWLLFTPSSNRFTSSLKFHTKIFQPSNEDGKSRVKWGQDNTWWFNKWTWMVCKGQICQGWVKRMIKLTWIRCLLRRMMIIGLGTMTARATVTGQTDIEQL